MATKNKEIEKLVREAFGKKSVSRFGAHVILGTKQYEKLKQMEALILKNHRHDQGK